MPVEADRTLRELLKRYPDTAADEQDDARGNRTVSGEALSRGRRLDARSGSSSAGFTFAEDVSRSSPAERWPSGVWGGWTCGAAAAAHETVGPSWPSSTGAHSVGSQPGRRIPLVPGSRPNRGDAADARQ